MALGVGPGDEVITTPLHLLRHGRHDCPARCTAGVLRHRSADLQSLAGAVEDFHSRAMRRSESGRLINRKTGGVIKALMPVHLFGQMADMDPLMEICAEATDCA